MDISKNRLLPTEKLQLLLDEIEKEINDPSCTIECCKALQKIKSESNGLLQKSKNFQEQFDRLKRYC